MPAHGPEQSENFIFLKFFLIYRDSLYRSFHTSPYLLRIDPIPLTSRVGGTRSGDCRLSLYCPLHCAVRQAQNLADLPNAMACVLHLSDLRPIEHEPLTTEGLSFPPCMSRLYHNQVISGREKGTRIRLFLIASFGDARR
jgi:hypothetical protein